jgi:uncharacterized protein YicC (UPF0701 family)
MGLLLAVSQLCVFPQSTGQLHEQMRLESQKRVADLHKQLKDSMTISQAEKQLAAACAVNCDQATSQVRDESRREGAHRLAVMNRLISQIHSEVDTYIAQAVDPTHHDSRTVEQELRQVLVVCMMSRRLFLF